MRILFAGDSLTEGKVGVSFVDMMRQDNWPEMVNAGFGGDTLLNVSARLLSLLKADRAFDYIVIEAGYNDIILPSFRKRGPLMWLLYRYLVYKGQRPQETTEAFQNAYAELILSVRAQTNAKIIITTLSCINERVDKPTNSKRQEYNDVIRTLAAQHKCLLADVAMLFDARLKQSPQTDYLMNNLLFNYALNKFKGGVPLSADELSQDRKLLLTIDGVHLNTQGASLFKQAIESVLSKL